MPFLKASVVIDCFWWHELERQLTTLMARADVLSANGQTRGLTRRTIVVGVPLLLANIYWLTELEMVRYNFPTYAVPFYTVIFTLLVLLIVNAMIGRLMPAAALTPAELMTLYVLISVPSGLASIAFTFQAVILMGHPFWFGYANPENRWSEVICPLLPKWLTVQDLGALRDYYVGHQSFYMPDNLRAWMLPSLWWCGFLSVLVFVMMCLMVLLRKRWTQAERLAYPVIELPYRMVTESGFFRRPALWWGFGTAGFITLINGLHELFPSVPYIPVKRQNLSWLLSQRPWSAMGWTLISLYPFAIGLAFLMPLDLCFSCWLFHLCYKFSLVAFDYLGWTQLPKLPYPREQALGAYLAIFLMFMWASRSYLKDVLRQALVRSADDADEPMRYRTALLGAALGMAFLIVFTTAAGMSWWLAGLHYAHYFIIALIITRIRAELGFFVHDLWETGPTDRLPELLGPKNLGNRNIAVMALFHWLNRFYQSHPMPHQLEGFKLADRVCFDRKSVVGASLLGVLIGAPCCFWFLLHIYYRIGAISSPPGAWGIGFGNSTYGRAMSWITEKRPADRYGWAAMGFGFAFTMLLASLRVALPSFPIHPLAYAVAPSWGMTNLWLCLIIASAAKYALLRFGGLETYRQAIPFFFGLTLGDYVIGAFWTWLGIVTKIKTYDFWP